MSANRTTPVLFGTAWLAGLLSLACVADAQAPTEAQGIDNGKAMGPMPFMRLTAEKLAKAVPKAQRRTIEGQAHDVSSKVLAPLLVKFFKGG